MKFAPLIPLAIALALWSGCAVGPDYEPPPLDAPGQFVAQDFLDELNTGKDMPAFPVNWWQGFEDPLLNELVEDSLANNFQIAAAAARLDAARAGVRLAGAGNKPRAAVSGEADYALEERLDIKQEDPDKIKSGLGRLAAVLPLDLFGRTKRRVEAARAGVDEAENELRGLVLEISAEVVREYLTLRGNQRQLALLEESVALQEKTLAIVKSRYDSGLSPELDMRRAETSVERLRAGVPRLMRTIADSRNRLATLAGRYPGEFEARLQDARDLPSYQARVAEAIPMDVLARRPDVREAEAALKRTVAGIGIATAELYPTLNLAAGVSVSATGINNMPTVELLVASLSGVIEQVLLDGGARKANIAIARALAEEALSDYRQTLLDACREVEAALLALHASQASQAALEKAVASSSRSFEQAEGLYQDGLISFLDVVDAQRVLADAEQALAAERTNYATQIATLFRALGTPIERPADTPAEEPPTPEP